LTPTPLNPPLQGKRIGIFRKDMSEFTGPFVESWKKIMSSTKMAEVSFLLTQCPY
jgi:hypothetical protein